MKKVLLLLLACVYALTGVWAGTIVSDNGTVTLDNLEAGDLAKALLPDQNVWSSGSANDLNSATKVIFGSTVTLNDEDLAALKTLVPAATQLDMSQVTLEEDADIANLETAAVEYLRLPNTMTSAEDVAKMATLKENNNNSALKMVGACDPDNSEYDDSSKKWAEISLYSFEANNVFDFLVSMGMRGQHTYDVIPRRIRMAGEYGENDLVNHFQGGSTPNFGNGTSAEWDFTGAHFADCTVAAATQDASYYNYDDPFCDGQLVKCPTTTNAFYYFSQYTTNVVDLKLPDNNMTHLPFRCISDLASDNVSGYKALYGETAFSANKEGGDQSKFVPIESLTIPNCYSDLDEECGKWARIRHLVIGSGMKRIHGGAFLKCDFLEDLDFSAGLSDCYVGDRSFNECNSMKHIALSEGIVSLGNGCFWNSQHMESIRLPESLINMGDHCFDNCLALNSITIPENVEKIGRAAFNLCPFTDIYLTTTDPAKIPYIWTAGTSFSPKDMNSTFYSPDFDGNNGIPNQASEIPSMSWDDAVQWYYVRANGIPVLHYPKELAEKVRAEISSTYGGRTNDDPAYGLPLQGDREKRANIPGADLGSAGTGKFSQDGWAQLMLMKEFTTDTGGDLYFKEYDDVWYTMCFPFDLSDEQLAAAFNETFNIVDFSAVEINKEENTLTLHFNNVAVTDYKDTDDNHYKRKTDANGSIIREKDPISKFSYNVYTRDNVEYHHVTTSSLLSKNKTKTFAPGSSMADAQVNFNSSKVAFLIDGILATAGHPYMIHPAIGVNDGGTTKKRCNFSGVEWKPQIQWAQIFHDNSRTIDLGIKKTLAEKPDSNYSHPGYSNYLGQTYTFIGNPNTHAAGAPEEPTVGNGLRDYPSKPTKEAYLPEPVKEAYPEEPTLVVVEEPEITLEAFEVQHKPAKVDNPGTLTANEQTLYTHLTEGQSEHNRGCWYGETLITSSYNDDSEQYTKWNTVNTYTYQNDPGISLYAGEEAKEASFNLCKNTFNKAKQAEAYAQYLIDLEEYESEYNDLQDAWADYNAYNPTQAQQEYETAHTQWETDCTTIDETYETSHTSWETDCRTKDSNYTNALTQWESDCADVDTYNEGVYSAWEEAIAAYKVQIPKNAYFLGRAAGAMYPKYYREMADVSYGGTRTKGLWPQFTAVIIPNAAAVDGIEKTIDGGGALSNSFEIKFNEDFEGDFIDQDDIQTIIEDARKEGVEPKVEYMDIVVNINGQIVRRDTTSFEGLPKGIYIINGKKYFVK